MADTYTAAGLAVAGCGAVVSALAYVFREWNAERRDWNKERADLVTKLEKVQADRVADAQKVPQELAALASNANRVLTENTAATKEVAKALTELREGVEGLPEEVVRSMRKRQSERDK
jgi:cytochrome c556